MKFSVFGKGWVGVCCLFGCLVLVYRPTREVEGVAGFVVKLVPAEVIRPHMYFFTLSYFVDNDFRN